MTGRSRERVDAGNRRQGYAAHQGGLVRWKAQGGDVVPERLTNFTARIVTERVKDDGLETRRLLELEAQVRGRGSRRFEITAAEFPSLGWVLRELGAGAIVEAANGTAQHVRAAIQHLSHGIHEERVFTHTGWRMLDDGAAFLHAAGAIDGDSAEPRVSLGAPLDRFELPPPPVGEPLAEALQESLRLLTIAPRPVTVPLLGAVWRAVLEGADFALWLAGPTGIGKSQLAALVQQHFGAGLDAVNLPGSWSSTGNSLEELAFAAKDVLLVVDDFAPEGSPDDVRRYHSAAARLLRAQGNHSARGRLNRDGSLRAPRPPRGLILGTGEDVPRGQSIRARMLVLELAPGDLDFGRLTDAQRRAADGAYARALAGFVKHLAERHSQLKNYRTTELARLRHAAAGSGHMRTPEIVANLGLAWELFLDFARQVGALTIDEAELQWQLVWEALRTAADQQLVHQAEAEPAGRFLSLLGAAISSGDAHLADLDSGSTPGVAPHRWGWRRLDGALDWRPQGRCVGWADDDENIYLEPDASYATAQDFARRQGSSLGVEPRTLRKRLDERGYLAARELSRQTLTIRKQVAGERRSVLHLSPGALNGQVDGQVAGQVSSHDLTTGNGSTKPVAPALVGLVRSDSTVTEAA